MRTPVILVAGQDHTDEVTGALLRRTGTVVVEHRFDGHVVRRMTATLSRGELITTEDALEFAHGCVSCTIRDDLLVLLRRLHRRDNVGRIVVHLAPWLEPQPICWAIDHVRVCVGHGYPDGPAALDVRVAAVVTCVDCVRWLPQSLGEDELPDGRTVAQVTVGQAEFADLLVLTHPEPVAVAVLRRLAPRARITGGVDRVELALAHLDDNSRRGRTDTPHTPLLAGLPPLAADGEVAIVEFSARRPFHPQRLHAAVDLLLDGVVVAGQPAGSGHVARISRWRSAGRIGRKVVGGDGGLGGGLCRPGAAVVRRPDVGLPVRRPAHRDDGTGMRRRSDRHRQCPERGAAQRRRNGISATLAVLRRPFRRLA